MKRSILLSLIFMPFVSIMAQDDDLYFSPTSTPAVQSVNRNSLIGEVDEGAFDQSKLAVYNNNSRNDDEYNRRYAGAGSMGYQTEGGNDYSYDYESNDTIFNTDSISDGSDDYAYSRRILRFHSPRVGIALSSPYYWDLVYGYGIYDYLYDAYYDPFFYSWGWRYGWAWGPWSSWYGPFWGWYHPYGWSYWGWGYGWHGHYAWNHGRYSQRGGGFVNRDVAKADGIRTNSLPNGGNASLSRGTFGSRNSNLASRSSIGRNSNNANVASRNSRTIAGRNTNTTTQARSSYSDYTRSRSSNALAGRSANTQTSRTRPSVNNNRTVTQSRSTQDRTTYSRPSSSRTITSTPSTSRSVSTPSRSYSAPSSAGRSSFGGGGSFGGGRSGGGGFGGGGGRGGRR